MNPFKYGDPVSGEYFMERTDLKKTVSNFLMNQINVVLMGPRRFGKTSFILDLQIHLEKEGFTPLYVDVYNVTTHRDFLQQLVNTLSKQRSLTQKMASWLKSLPSRFKPEMSIEGDASSAGLKFSLAAYRLTEAQVKQLISNTLESLSQVSKKVCIAFDEFQTIGALDDSGWLEATIRSKMQLTKNASFLFSGSRHGMIHDMFNNTSRPFYRSCQLIDFSPPGPDFTDWIIKRFKKAGIACPSEPVDYLRKLVGDTSNYVQMACFHIVAGDFKTVDKKVVDEVLNRITSQNAYPYQTIVNSLTPVQQRVLRMAACEGEAIYSRDILEKYEIKSGAHVSQAINSLVAKQILDSSTGSGKAIFDDPLFAIWLKKEFGV